MGREVGRIVAVQQVQLHPADLGLPDAQPDRVAGQGDLEPQPLAVGLAQGRDGQLARVVVGEQGLLRPVLVDLLAEITLLVEQAHADDRHPQVAAGLELVAGHIAESAGIDGQGLAQHEFQAEIGDAGQRRPGMLQLEPGLSGLAVPPGPHAVVRHPAEGGIGQGLLEPVPGDGLQDHPGVPGQLPEGRVQLAPELVGTVVPGPAQVQG